jgi:hypothetical protein
MRRAILQHRKAHDLNFVASRLLAVIVPYRNRQQHLEVLLPKLTAHLKADGIDHRVIVVEQLDAGPFNRGRLINVGMNYAQSWADYYCIHDVDAIPLVASYQCPSMPLRLVTTVTRSGVAVKRADHYFSGAISIRKEQAFACNGFSNDYWGWGKEDDDFFFRLLVAGYICFYDSLGVFEDLPNPADESAARQPLAGAAQLRRNRKLRSQLVRGIVSSSQDGLSTLRYELSNVENNGFWDKISVRW